MPLRNQICPPPPLKQGLKRQAVIFDGVVVDICPPPPLKQGLKRPGDYIILAGRPNLSPPSIKTRIET